MSIEYTEEAARQDPIAFRARLAEARRRTERPPIDVKAEARARREQNYREMERHLLAAVRFEQRQGNRGFGN